MMYKTPLKKSVLLISLALPAAALAAVDLKQHLSFDYKIPDVSAGNLRAGLTTNACYSITDPMVIRLQLADVDRQKYDVNLKINGQDAGVVMTAFKANSELVKPFLVSTDNKMTELMTTGEMVNRVVKKYRPIEPYCLRPRSAPGGTNAHNQGVTSSGYKLYDLAGLPPYGEGSTAHPEEWAKCRVKVQGVTPNERGEYRYPAPITLGAGALTYPEQRPLVFNYENSIDNLDPSQYEDEDHLRKVQMIIKGSLEQSRDGTRGIVDAVDHDFWLKYMFYKRAEWITDYERVPSGQPNHWPKFELLSQAEKDKLKKPKPLVDYTIGSLPGGTYNNEKVQSIIVSGEAISYTSQRDIQSIVLTVTRKGQVPVTHSFTWTRSGKSNVLLPSSTGNLVKPSAQPYAADHYQTKGFYAATTPGFYRGTLVTSAGLNTNYTNNPAPLSRPAGTNGSINLVNTNELTLVLRKEGNGISALFYGQPLQFSDLKFDGGKIPAHQIRNACY